MTRYAVLVPAFLTLWLCCVTAGDVTGFSPLFCHDHPCPKFEVEEKHDNYETRTYAESTWACTEIKDSKFEIAYVKGVRALSKYFGGENEQHQKLDETRPVATAFKPKNGFRESEKDYVVHEYIPPGLQDNPPKPTQEEIRLITYPKSTFYVSDFGGFATEQTILQEAGKLADALRQDGVKFDDSWFVFANYNSITRLKDRHNEVWFMESKPAVSIE